MIDIDRILLEFELLPDYEDRIGLQTVSGEDHFYGVHEKRVTWQDNNINHKAEDFTEFCFPQLKYTNSVISDLKMFRTRVMVLKPKTCYSYHRDMSIRVHIPLITNTNCMFIIDDELKRYPADGNHYVIDTRKRHTALNASFEERIHIVGCVS